MSENQFVRGASPTRHIFSGLTIAVAAACPGSPVTASAAERVTVVNTAADPVPVTGNFGITGTANVTVTNAALPVTGTISVKPPPTFHALSTELPFSPVAVDLTQRGTVIPSYEKCRISLGLTSSFQQSDSSSVIVFDIGNQTHRLAVLDVRGNAPVNFVVDAPGNGFVLYVSSGAFNNPPGAEVYCR